MGLTKIVIRGARQHNLKNISLEIPRNTLTVITGLSGSGKSSLAFDTIYAEGQRRYVESLSAYARQFLDQMERPDVDSIEGLSPSIAIEQKTTTRSPRSTVGTITEIYDYLRVVYSSIGTPHCPKCGKPIARQSTDQIVQADPARRACQDRRPRHDPRAHRARPKGRVPKGTGKTGAATASSARASTATSCPLDDPPRLDKRKNHTIEVVIDRLLVKPGIAQRLEQSIATALKLARRSGHRRRGRRRRARLFRKTGLPRLRHFRAAARAALVQLQFAVWRVPGMQRPRLEIRFRSGKDNCGLDAAALRRRARSRLGLRYS